MRTARNWEGLLYFHQAGLLYLLRTANRPASRQSKIIGARYRSYLTPSSKYKAKQSTAVGVLRKQVRRESHGQGPLVDGRALGSDEIRQLEQDDVARRSHRVSESPHDLTAPRCGPSPSPATRFRLPKVHCDSPQPHLQTQPRKQWPAPARKFDVPLMFDVRGLMFEVPSLFVLLVWLSTSSVQSVSSVVP